MKEHLVNLSCHRAEMVWNWSEFLGTTIFSSGMKCASSKEARQSLPAPAQKAWGVQRGESDSDRNCVLTFLYLSVWYGNTRPQLSRGSSWRELFAPPPKSSAANSPLPTPHLPFPVSDIDDTRVQHKGLKIRKHCKPPLRNSLLRERNRGPSKLRPSLFSTYCRTILLLKGSPV